LVDLGYIRQESSQYTLGPRLIRLGDVSARMLSVWARPYLARLVDELGESRRRPNVRDHLLRNIFRYASRKYWDQIANHIGPVYTGPSEAAANERFVEFTATWGAQYPAIIRLWENALSEFDQPLFLLSPCDWQSRDARIHGAAGCLRITARR
jgi:Transposase, Mutator family